MYTHIRRKTVLGALLLAAGVTHTTHPFLDWGWLYPRPRKVKKVKKQKHSDQHKQINKLYALNEQQAQNYIAQCVAALDHALSPEDHDQDLLTLKEAIYSTIPDAPNIFIWRFGKRWYNKDLVDLYMNSAILELIEHDAYTYALEKTHNEIIAKKVTNSMLNNVLATIQQSASLNLEQLAPYFGAALRQKVRDAINNFDAPYQHDFNNYTPTESTYTEPPAEPSMPPVYVSEDCCVCYESFQDVKPIFLRPCGHDICAECAQRWFLDQNPHNDKTCPLCRSHVDLGQLWEDLNHAATTA